MEETARSAALMLAAAAPPDPRLAAPPVRQLAARALAPLRAAPRSRSGVPASPALLSAETDVASASAGWERRRPRHGPRSPHGGAPTSRGQAVHAAAAAEVVRAV